MNMNLSMALLFIALPFGAQAATVGTVLLQGYKADVVAHSAARERCDELKGMLKSNLLTVTRGDVGLLIDACTNVDVLGQVVAVDEKNINALFKNNAAFSDELQRNSMMVMLDAYKAYHQTLFITGKAGELLTQVKTEMGEAQYSQDWKEFGKIRQFIRDAIDNQSVQLTCNSKVDCTVGSKDVYLVSCHAQTFGAEFDWNYSYYTIRH